MVAIIVTIVVSASFGPGWGLLAAFLGIDGLIAMTTSKTKMGA